MLRTAASGVGMLVLAAALSLASPAPAQVLEPLPEGTGQPGNLLGPDDAPAKPQAWQAQRVEMPASPVRILAPGSGLAKLASVRILTEGGDVYSLASCATGICANKVTATYEEPRLPDGALPGSRLTSGRARIRHAWLADPTRRLGASAIGAWVAGALVVEDDATREHRLQLPLDQAFEDTEPRLVELDADGTPSVVAVRSSLDRGASLVVARLEGEGLLRIAAETPPLGRPHAWLNPIGFGDVDGDGRLDIVVVVSPDDGGRLQVLDLEGTSFRTRYDLKGVSNHVPGTMTARLGVIADFDGDKVLDVAVPSGDRTRLRILSFRGGAVAEPASVELPAPIVTEVVGIAGKGGERPFLVMGLADGSLQLVH